MEYSVSVDIHASPEKIWSELIAVECWPEWTRSTTYVNRLDSGPIGIGSRVRVKQPKLMPMIWTVSEFEPERSFTWIARASGMTTVGEHRLSPGDGQTVTVTLNVQQTGLLAPIVSLLAANTTRRYVNMEAQGLKQRCEETDGRLGYR